MIQQLSALGLLLVIFIAPALAQVKLNLRDVVSLALEQSPDALAITRDRSMHDAQSYELEQRKNIELEIETTLLEDNASTGISAELTLPYKPAQWSDRQLLASTMRNMSNTEAKMRLLSLKHRVTQAYLDLWLVQEHKAFLQENLQFAQSIYKAISTAALRGEISKAVSILLQAELLSYEDELIELKAQEQLAQIHLFNLINKPLEKVELEAPLLSVLPKQINKQQQKLSRELLVARLSAAIQRMNIAKKDASFPELSPRVFYNESFDNDIRTFGVGVRLQWPFSGSNKAELARAQAEQTFATESLAAYDNLQYEKILQQALEQAWLMHDRTRQYTKKIIPAYELSFRAMRQMYQNGQAPVTELWQFHERLHQAEIKRLEVLQQAFSAEMKLESLVGAALDQKIQRGE